MALKDRLEARKHPELNSAVSGDGGLSVIAGTRHFWLISVSIFLVSAGTYGMLSQIVSITTDRGADKTQHRRLADVDVPTEHRNSRECRQDLGHDGISRYLRAACTGRTHRLDLAFVDLFDSFVEQFGAEAD